jgi:hypothetical protein
LLIREDCSNDESIATCSQIHHSQRDHYTQISLYFSFCNLTEEGEVVPEGSGEPNGPVDDQAEDEGNDETGGQLTDNLSEEVGTHSVHVVVNFSEEDCSLRGEKQDDVLHCTESHHHRCEEESSIDVLHSSVLLRIGSCIDDIHDETDDYCDEELDFEGLGETHDVDKGTLGQQTPLVTPGCSFAEFSRILNRLHFRAKISVIILQFAALVAIEEIFHLLLILFNSISMLLEQLVSILEFSLLFSSLNTHDCHEEISWVSHFWAGILNSLEVVNCLAGFVEVDDLTESHENQVVENLEDFGGGLVNC